MLKTPLHAFHLGHQAKMVEFAGWEMPIVYQRDSGGGIVEEHVACRTSGGFFDVSHMGRVKFSGRHARRLLERVCTRRISDMKPGQCRYSLVLNERGGIKDDVIVYRQDEDQFLVVVNASNRAKLMDHFKSAQAAGQLVLNIDDQTESTAMVAVQGPRVIPFISKFSSEIPTLKRYTFTTKNLLIMKLVVSRTGYTGEDGVEVILPASMVGMAMKMLFKDIDMSAADALVRPCGLGARDTLRLEAAMPLYGHELGEETDPLATGLDFAIAIDKDADERGEPYIGMEALKATRAAGGPKTKLVGLAIDGKRSARQGMAVCAGDTIAGTVTSGAPSPTLGYPIALAYVAREHAAEGTTLRIETGKGEGAARFLEAKVVKTPFYKAPKP